MSKLMHVLLLTGAVAAAGEFASPQTTSADDYWSGYWSWYDNDYRPYHSRRHYYRPYREYRYYDDGYYRNDDDYYYRDYRYAPRNRYYRDYYGRGWDDGGGYLQLGPLGIGWD